MSIAGRAYTRIPRWETASPEEWDDWRWQLRHAISTVDELESVIALTDDERRGYSATRESFRMSIPPYYAALMDERDPSCPIRMMAVPRAAEALVGADERRDPLGEDTRMPVPHLVHRYEDRALLLVNNMCAMYCRFCTRKRLTGEENEAISRADLERIVAYLRVHGEVRDVLVSGGDPWTMGDRRLAELLSALRSVPTVEIVRFGTRMPVVLPQRVTAALVEVLRAHAPIWVMTHFNHPKELTTEALSAIARLVDAGIPVANQAVLLRGVNSSARIVQDLFLRLSRARVHAYYLHQCDLAEGVESFRTPLALGVEIIRALRGRTSGYAVPHFALDLPGGGGKITLTPDWRDDADVPNDAPASPRVLRFRNHAGVVYEYPDVPADLDCACAYESKWYAPQTHRATLRAGV
jgi:lysine 2,3-aminomutase